MGKLILGTTLEKGNKLETKLLNGKIVTLDMHDDEAPITDLLLMECAVLKNVHPMEMYEILRDDKSVKSDVYSREEAKKVIAENFNNLINRYLKPFNKDVSSATDEEINQSLHKIEKSVNNNIRFLYYSLFKNFLILNCLKYYEKVKK